MLPLALEAFPLARTATGGNAWRPMVRDRSSSAVALLRPLPSASREVSVGWEPAIRFRRIRMPQTRDTRRPCTCSRDSSVASGLSAGLIRSCGKVLAVYFPEGVGLLELMQRV
jgi:hypothetical protein